jgi:hypothetical protein
LPIATTTWPARGRWNPQWGGGEVGREDADDGEVGLGVVADEAPWNRRPP